MGRSGSLERSAAGGSAGPSVGRFSAGPSAAASAGRAPAAASSSGAWDAIRQRLRDRGLRWTPQRRLLVDVLARTDGHVTGSELVERCREADPATIPSTVYRTLDVLEDLGLVRHCHGVDGREEFHVLPETEHGHFYCAECGRSWDIEAREATAMLASFEAQRGFEVDVSHLTVVGRCGDCREPAEGSAGPPDGSAGRAVT